jgi:hypothetical protein
VQDIERFIKHSGKALGQAAVATELQSLLQRFVDTNVSPESSANYRATARDNAAAMLHVLEHELLGRDAAFVLLSLTVRPVPRAATG